MDAAIEAENISRKFGDVDALASVNLIIRSGEFFSLLGPSGCGKTTLLRIIAGLEFADSGVLKIYGEDASRVPAHLRPVNTVFQSYALFPHMTVFDNVAFGLRMKKLPPDEVRRKVEHVMEMVQISPLANRKPAQLSGGQQQRVALSRAVVNEPKVLLLDEPLGALDSKLRKELQVELLALQRRLGITFVFVTHDQEEALVLSDRIAVMNQGKFEQIGDSESLYEYPRTRFVSRFLGTSNLLDGAVLEESPAGAKVGTKIGDLRIGFEEKCRRPNGRKSVTLAIRPEKLRFADTDVGVPNCVRVRVEELLYIGSETHYLLRAGDERLIAETMNVTNNPSGPELGAEAWVQLPPENFIVLDD